MKIDLHIHSKTCSDGRMTVDEIMREASRIGLGLLAITDHDSVDCQESALALAGEWSIHYLTGLELNIVFSHEGYRDGKPVSLDLLAYGYDFRNGPLIEKTRQLTAYRKQRAEQILERVNTELEKERRALFTQEDMQAIEKKADGALGRPHIAAYMIEKGIVSTRQEAFDRYLVRCDVPKMSVSLEEASQLVRAAGGRVVLAHPSDPNGTSLASLTRATRGQQEIIRQKMLPFLDGIECWHPRHDQATATSYSTFAKAHNLILTGGSDCHQNPLMLGRIRVPPYVAEQFGIRLA
jgi:3',5'-nucleoside bisphosphate phosphatase